MAETVSFHDVEVLEREISIASWAAKDRPGSLSVVADSAQRLAAVVRKFADSDSEARQWADQLVEEFHRSAMDVKYHGDVMVDEARDAAKGSVCLMLLQATALVIDQSSTRAADVCIGLSGK